jgi:hypothetical protein
MTFYLWGCAMFIYFTCSHHVLKFNLNKFALQYCHNSTTCFDIKIILICWHYWFVNERLIKWECITVYSESLQLNCKLERLHWCSINLDVFVIHMQVEVKQMGCKKVSYFFCSRHESSVHLILWKFSSANPVKFTPP